MGPGDLRGIMGDLLGEGRDAAVLVGMETGDDAGVCLLSGPVTGPATGPSDGTGQDELALVVTADYITPLLDDPYIFGQIAAANALSDVYAMGGQPRAALNLCVFPRELPEQAAREILAGARDKVTEAGAHILGGHTVRGPELLFGLSVTGTVHKGRIWRNVGALIGDQLLLTKPLGTGLLVTGHRKKWLSLTRDTPAVQGMEALNRGAQDVLSRFSVHAATDVTGFGLVGHALGMMRGSINLALRIEVSRLPAYEGAEQLARQGITCAGATANREAYRDQIALEGGALDPALEELIYDPQTSGGLLVALPASEAALALAALQAVGIAAALVGSVIEASAPDARLVLAA